MIDYVIWFIAEHETAAWFIGAALAVALVLLDLATNPGIDPNLGFRDGSADFWGFIISVGCAVKGLRTVGRR